MTTSRIQIDPSIMMGKPVIRGTRITVELLLRKLADGASETDILRDYPHLTPEDIRAAFAYAAASVARQVSSNGQNEASQEEHLALATARLSALKSLYLPTDGKAERVRHSLEAIRRPFGISLTSAQWAAIAQESEEDDI